MTIHQVEEYYIHIGTKNYSEEGINDAKAHLENDGHDFEIQSDCIVVDGFCDEGEAKTIENEIMNQLNGVF